MRVRSIRALLYDQKFFKLNNVIYLTLTWYGLSKIFLPSTTLKHTQVSINNPISQLRIVHSGLHLVTYLHVSNFCDKSTETTLHEICMHFFLRFSNSSKPSQSVSLIYELSWLAGIGKSEKNLLKTSC